jgi:DNA-directed RNA polymerase specialized sigma subunit
MISRSDMRKLLWRWGACGQYIKCKQREVNMYTERQAGAVESAIRAKAISGMPKGTAVADPTQKAALKLYELAAAYEQRMTEIEQDIQERIQFERTIDECVDKLRPDQQRILDLRYKRRNTWAYIGERMWFSVNHAKKLEALAIDRVRKSMPIIKDDTF